MGPGSKAQGAAEHSIAGHRDLPFGEAWKFHLSEGPGLEAATLDDSGWGTRDLPHHWSIEGIPGNPTGPFVKTAKGGTAVGFTLGGEGWYRKHFRVDRYPHDARIEVLFDGAYLLTEVFLNGQRVGGNVHGYIPFALDLTPHLDRSGDNVLAVRVRNLGENSRWYSGSGLYREVTLDVLPAGARLERWGVAAWTRRIADGRATIDVSTEIADSVAGLELVTRLRDSGGQVVAEATSAASAKVQQSLAVRAPKLWSPDSPALYTLETELRRAGQVVDSIAQPFGVRIIAFDAKRGMTINGVRTTLRGGCLHHDNGLLGACAYPDADMRRVRLLKERGFNAIRSSHNPASRSLRDACDRLGLLVIEEAFDSWVWQKLPDDFHVRFAEHWEEVIGAMVRSARNSPSVIMWSIGNEIPNRSSSEGVEWEWKLANAIRRLDPTRPVTEGLNGTVLGAPMVAGERTARAGMGGKVDNASTIFLDVPGYNYRLAEIEREAAEHPERVVYASETFPRDVFEYRALTDRAPYFLGEFPWSAMDYLGEAGVGLSVPVKKGVPFYVASWPWIVSWCGDIDLIGHQKPQSLARDVAWGLSGLEVTVARPLPEGMSEFVSPWGWPDEAANWTLPGLEGKPVTVRLYSSGDRVQLRLNGTMVAEKPIVAADAMKAEIELAYAPGTLEAVAWRGGRIIGRRKLETVGAPAAIHAMAEPVRGKGGRGELVYLPIEIRDGAGRRVPQAALPLTIEVSGAAVLAAFGSADPKGVRSFQAHSTSSFDGRALAILRLKPRGGPVRVTIASPGLTGANVTVRDA